MGQAALDQEFLNGTLELHEQLENEIAEYVGKQAALVFSTGMQTNLGVISALISRNDVIILDKDDHASIVDGAKLSWGETKRFRHNDMQELEIILESIPEKKGKLVAVDGLYSMGGDIAPLPEISKLCKAYGARLMVDDAHAIGVLGGGRGTAAHYGLTGETDLIMSTFSKSFASLGGFIAGDEEVIHYIKHFARSLIFSASIPPANAAAALTALKIMRDEPERIQRLTEIAEFMRNSYRSMGFNTLNSTTPVIPILIGDTMNTVLSWKQLFQDGVFVNPVLNPAVPAGQELLRTSFMATHTDVQLQKVLEIFEKVGKQFGLI